MNRDEDDDEKHPFTQADAVNALHRAGLVHDEDVIHSCMGEDGAGPFAVGSNGEDFEIAWVNPDTDGETFRTHWFGTRESKLVATALAGLVFSPDRWLLAQALRVLDDVASAADNDARLRARVGGLEDVRRMIRERLK